MAKELASQINVNATIDGLAGTVRNMAARIVKQEAPELDDGQIEELVSAWVPGADGRQPSAGNAVPAGLLLAMVGQFVAYSRGAMDPAEERELRSEMGAWPDRYWKSFPPVVQVLVRGYLKGEMDEREFNVKIGAALSLGER
ncbi:MAG: hypothetical protein LBL20_00865 [Treponema sp.]|jgi:hypothetical protein|nr:hypothetical protein [Treponema sp.]